MDLFCTNCGTKIEGVFKFCPSCGSPVVKQDKSDNECVSNKFMEYKVTENGEAIFYLNAVVGKGELAKTVKIEHAKGNGAELCKNGLVAMQELEKSGYIFKNTEMPMFLKSQFDLESPDCDVLSSDVITKLYKATTFFRLLGYDLKWKQLPALFSVPFSDFPQLELVKVLATVMKVKMGIDLPCKDGNKLRFGESLLLCANNADALEWYKDCVETYEDEDGYNSNIIGCLYLNMFQNTKDSVGQNYKNAVEWLRRSAERKNLLGNINLGHLYADGIGVEKNINEALQRYLQAYEQGSEYAITSFKSFMIANFVDIHETGFKMHEGYSYETLADECEEKAKDKDDLALLNIAYMYHHGLGRNTNIDTAVSYYKKATVQYGNPSVIACRMLDMLRHDGYSNIIDNNSSENNLKHIANMAKTRIDAIHEKDLVEKMEFGDPKPQSPELIDSWIMGGEKKDYKDNACYSKEEYNAEKQVYTRLMDIYNTYSNKFDEQKNKRILELEQSIKRLDAELNGSQDFINEITNTGYKALEILAFASEYSTTSGKTIEEGIFEYNNKSKCNTVNKVQGNNVVVSKGEGFVNYVTATDYLGDIIKTENKIMSLKADEARLRKCKYIKNLPLKPALKEILHENVPTIVYKGRLCYTLQEYKDKLNVFFVEMDKYYAEKLQWIGSLPQTVMNIQKNKEELSDKIKRMYSQINLAAEFQNIEALEYIQKTIVSKQCSLDEACEEYNTFKSNCKNNKEIVERNKKEQLKHEDISYKRAEVDSEYIEPEPEYGMMQEEWYEDSSDSSSFARDVAASVIGAVIANHGIKKEIKALRREEEERERERKREREAEERAREHEEAVRSQREWNRIHKLNEERKRKGLPELPYPERFWW